MHIETENKHCGLPVTGSGHSDNYNFTHFLVWGWRDEAAPSPTPTAEDWSKTDCRTARWRTLVLPRGQGRGQDTQSETERDTTRCRMSETKWKGKQMSPDLYKKHDRDQRGGKTKASEHDRDRNVSSTLRWWINAVRKDVTVKPFLHSNLFLLRWLKVCNLMKLTVKIRLKCKYGCNLHRGYFKTIILNFPQHGS